MAKKTVVKAALKPKATPKRTYYMVANHHTGAIVFPRKGVSTKLSDPLILPAGQSIQVDAAEWNELRKSAGVKLYLDHRLISEVKFEGPVAVTAVTTVEPNIPPHLLRDGEEVTGHDHGGAQPKASVVKSQAAEVDLKL